MPRPSRGRLQGTVDVLIRKSLTWNPKHGFARTQRIRERTDGVLSLEDAALYQGLHRLERQDLVVSEWGLSDNNRRARYYQLTPAGTRRLREETATWRAYAGAVFKVLDARSAAT
jgi:transcriptional regulator